MVKLKNNRRSNTRVKFTKTIPFGIHKGRDLRSLNYHKLLEMWNHWQADEFLKTTDFLSSIWIEIQRRDKHRSKKPVASNRKTG